MIHLDFNKKGDEVDVVFAKKRLVELRENIKWAEPNNREYSVRCFTCEYVKLLKSLRNSGVIK